MRKVFGIALLLAVIVALVSIVVRGETVLAGREVRARAQYEHSAWRFAVTVEHSENTEKNK